MLLPIILSIFVHSAAGQYVDRPCGKDIGNLWLDIVILIDNSNGMTQNGLNQVVQNIGDVFKNGTRIGVHLEPRTTRVGVVTYSNQATTVADMKQLQSYESLVAELAGVSISGNDTSYLAIGLVQAFNTLFGDNSRSNYQKVILVYAASYQGTGKLDPATTALKVKEDGAIIVTVGMVENGGDGGFLGQLAAIATSTNYALDNLSGGSLVEKVQNGLLQVNCFCPINLYVWRQYQTSYTDKNSYKYGTCLQDTKYHQAWSTAKIDCQGRVRNGYLATENTKAKHDFMFQLVREDFKTPYAYYIGLTFVNGGWYWQQPKNMALVPLGNETFWAPGFPTSMSTNTGVVSIQDGKNQTASWQNINPYTASHQAICEVDACDTDNYCP